jgi:Na+-translocating ferredoxin:NAD+ oxidoreductase RnfA subunit
MSPFSIAFYVVFGGNLLVDWGLLASPEAMRQQSRIEFALFIIVSCCTSFIFGLVHHWLLVPLGLEALIPVVFGIVIIAIQALTNKLGSMTFRNIRLHHILQKDGAVPYPLLFYSIAMLSASLGNLPWMSLYITVASILGYAASTVLLDDILHRLEREPVPDSFKGSPIRFLSAGLIALVFSGINTIFRTVVP